MAVLSGGSSDEQILGVVDQWADLLVEGRFEEAREVVAINHEVIESEYNTYVSGRAFLGPKRAEETYGLPCNVQRATSPASELSVGRSRRRVGDVEARLEVIANGF